MELKKKLKDLTEQVLYREMSDQMESYVLDKTQTFAPSVSNEAGEKRDTLSSTMHSGIPKTPFIEFASELPPKQDSRSSKHLHVGKDQGHMSRYSLRQKGPKQEPRFNGNRFPILEREATKDSTTLQKFFSNKEIGKEKTVSHQLSPIKPLMSNGAELESNWVYIKV